MEGGGDQASQDEGVFKLLDPSRLLIANSPSISKEIQNGMKQFEKLTKYKDKLEELALKMASSEDKLMDELL